MVMNCPGYSKEFDTGTLFRTLLVPVDFTPESRRALITACELRGRFGSELHVFLSRGGGEHSRSAVNSPASREQIEASAREQLRYFGESICEGMTCLSTETRFGDDVVEGIVQAVEDCGATMVILGVHPEHSLFLRTRAEKIQRALDVPMLVLKGAPSPATPAPTP